uniref:Radical SAM superfamily enzyme YgiQ, UPF0313 family n=1 Tax=Candidatus Kentrum sp. LFY TaxID=2126342 RepID=A0A450V8K8_9GAMM|nr:MAG: Radical SAM superfamily enzyme YgiQ, UPF0313 family [Candidatus Kentron sp. LFY]
MRVLLLYPRFPKSYSSFHTVIELMGKKTHSPPLGLITVAAILPQEWEFKLVDLNIREVTEEEWNWAEFVMVSAMLVQRVDFFAQIQEGKRRGKKVAVGGPYPTAFSDDVARHSEADYLVLDEGEMTIPQFLAAIERGDKGGVFRSAEKPDVRGTPFPRYDLLELDAYLEMSIQFSRGCPFQCEFCDIITLYGRKPRTKAPEQMLRELEYLYECGWRGAVFMVDDNFIGNKRDVEEFLRVLKGWMAEKKYPFLFYTEASMNLAKYPKLMESMTACNFDSVFVGLETPDAETLTLIKKSQNLHAPISESIAAIKKAGIHVMANFVIGFDGEKPGIDRRVIQLVEENALPMPMFSLLFALPNTALWHRLKKEGRLLEGDSINQNTAMNFVPTRPIEEIVDEFLNVFEELYEPKRYIERNYRHFMQMGKMNRNYESIPFGWGNLGSSVRVFWLEGIVRKTRWRFWYYLFKIMRSRPEFTFDYLFYCIVMEHFTKSRDLIRNQVKAQLPKL